MGEKQVLPKIILPGGGSLVGGGDCLCSEDGVGPSQLRPDPTSLVGPCFLLPLALLAMLLLPGGPLQTMN